MVKKFITVVSCVRPCVDTVASYMLWVILKASIISTHSRLDFRVGRFKWKNLSL